MQWRIPLNHSNLSTGFISGDAILENIVSLCPTSSDLRKWFCWWFSIRFRKVIHDRSKHSPPHLLPPLTTASFSWVSGRRSVKCSKVEIYERLTRIPDKNGLDSSTSRQKYNVSRNGIGNQSRIWKEDVSSFWLWKKKRSWKRARIGWRNLIIKTSHSIWSSIWNVNVFSSTHWFPFLIRSWTAWQASSHRWWRGKIPEGWGGVGGSVPTLSSWNSDNAVFSKTRKMNPHLIMIDKVCND